MTLNISVTDEQLGQYYRRTTAIADRLGKSLNFETVMGILQQIHDGQVGGVKNEFLHRLYEDKEILVGATTGEETIADASDLFPGFLDSDFKNWETNKPSNVATEPAPATVFEMYEKSGTFRQIFGSLGNIDDLCWEQGQILNFVREHSDKLHPKNWATFLPFKVKEIEEPFVAFVIRDAGELKAVVYRFGDVYVWDAWRCRRVVVPQLES